MSRTHFSNSPSSVQTLQLSQFWDLLLEQDGELGEDFGSIEGGGARPDSRVEGLLSEVESGSDLGGRGSGDGGDVGAG